MKYRPATEANDSCNPMSKTEEGSTAARMSAAQESDASLPVCPPRHVGHCENAQHHERPVGTQGKVDECQVNERGKKRGERPAETSLGEQQTEKH